MDVRRLTIRLEKGPYADEVDQIACAGMVTPQGDMTARATTDPQAHLPSNIFLSVSFMYELQLVPDLVILLLRDLADRVAPVENLAWCPRPPF